MRMTEHHTPSLPTFPSASRRRYRQGRRLESVEDTRRRITAAAFELHATIGQSRTTIRAIADRAGVQRNTVYAHFPDLETLYEACTAHGIRVTGMPSAEPWSAIADPPTRLRHGLRELFAWYRANALMLRNVLYDGEPAMPPPTEPDTFEIRMRSLLTAFSDGWVVTEEDGRSMLLAFLVLAMGFETWQSLASSGLADERAVDLLVSIATGIASGTITDNA